MFYQSISLLGAAMILIAYAGSQTGRIGRQDLSYNVLNFVGSALLGWVAIVDRRAGFIVLECAWALLSIQPMIATMRKTPASSKG
jgi:hypothetical protein